MGIRVRHCAPGHVIIRFLCAARRQQSTVVQVCFRHFEKDSCSVSPVSFFDPGGLRQDIAFPSMASTHGSVAEDLEPIAEAVCDDANARKSALASLLYACEDEAKAQLKHQEELMKAQAVQEVTLSNSLKSRPKKSASFGATTKAMKAVAERLHTSGLDPILVPPVRVLDLLRLNLATYVDFKKFMMSNMVSTGEIFESALAQTMDGEAVLIRRRSS
ncbi:hypothetical protein FOZ60_015562 [Perkinsus olseni]|uniref:Uncharacterized protein n=1 Tax=Perkinsus olseni TaxID=32597 RepID=A0A7J6P5P4_PEROL|nr:hypothetical protein FOZ60_015562 [Perkinsus olseni]